MAHGKCYAICISIHSLRMEGDGATYTLHEVSAISIHSLRMEGDANTKISTYFHI